MNRYITVPERILEAFWRHRWLFTICVLTVVTVTSAALLLRNRTYTATALTQVVKDETAAAVGVKTGDGSWNTPAQQSVNHFNDLIRDDLPGGFVDTVLKDANLAQPINVDPKAKDVRLSKLRQGLFARAESDRIFSIGLIWENPAECERIVQAMQERFVEEVGMGRQAQAIATAKFLESEIDNYRRRMRTAEAALIDYKQKNSGRLPEAQTAEIEQLSRLKADMADLAITARDSQMQRQALLQRIKQIRPTSILEQTLAGETELTPTEQRLQELKTLHAATLAEGWLPTSQKVKAIEKQIAALEALRVKEAKSRKPRIVETKMQDNPEYQALMAQLTEANIAQSTRQSQVAALQKQIAQSEARIAKIPTAQKVLADKTRDYSILKEQYETLLERREEAQIKANLDRVSAASTLNRIGAVYAQSTTSGKKKAIMVLGSIVLGVVVGCLLILLLEWSDRSLRYEEDAERLVGLPVFASIPEAQELKVLPAVLADLPENATMGRIYLLPPKGDDQGAQPV